MPIRRPSAAAAALTAVPEGDRTRAFVGELRTLVKATYVVFARYDQSGTQNEVVLAEDHGNPARQTEWLQAERLLQSRSEAMIPRVTDAMIALDGMRGLVAVYGVDRTIFGMAIVARPRPFVARGAEGARRDAAPRLRADAAAFDVRRRAERAGAHRRARHAGAVRPRPRLRGRVALDPRRRSERRAAEHPGARRTTRCRRSSSRRSATLTAAWTDDPATWREGNAVPLPFMVVRVAPLTGRDGRMKIGVLVERYRSRNPLRHAAEKFGMSSRELEVLVPRPQGLRDAADRDRPRHRRVDRPRPRQADDAQDARPQPRRARRQSPRLARRLDGVQRSARALNPSRSSLRCAPPRTRKAAAMLMRCWGVL